MTKIKICGLSRVEDISLVNEALPDYIGFVFAKSKRQVGEALAEELKSKLSPSILSVGVFVNEARDKIIRLCKKNIIDLVQLHGDEDNEYINLLKANIAQPIIKAVRVSIEEDIKGAEEYNCDYLLLDTYKEGLYGGSGHAFDWNLISGITKPFFLAGGVNTENVLRAIEIVKPYGVDVSSGVETEGMKDREKIIDIITKVRSVR